MPLNVSMFNDEMALLVDDAQESLVQITGPQGNLGSGIIWREDGLIVTNAHVVRDSEVHVTLLDGTVHKATMIAVDDTLDIAALTIDAMDLPTARVGDSRKLRPGQWVVAVGHPFGVLGSATAGTVIATGTGLPEFGGEREWIALDLRLRPGHSGGPLIDVNGNTVGINTLITGPEVGFAIPVHLVEAFLREHVQNSNKVASV
jgi:serine protease Do